MIAVILNLSLSSQGLYNKGTDREGRDHAQVMFTLELSPLYNVMRCEIGIGEWSSDVSPICAQPVQVCVCSVSRLRARYCIELKCRQMQDLAIAVRIPNKIINF